MKDKYLEIERYLGEEMSTLERADFESRLLKNKTLRAELKLHQEVEETLQDEKLTTLHGVLQQADAQFRKKSIETKQAKTVSLFSKKILSVAAAIAILIGIAVWLWRPAVSPSEVFASNYEPYIMVLNQRSNTPDAEAIKNAVRYYELGDYTTAATAFSELFDSSNKENITYRFYTAISLLSSGQADKSILIFEELIVSENIIFREQSRWYAAMTYLQKNDLENARKMLEEIEEGAYKFQEAQKILKTI